VLEHPEAALLSRALRSRHIIADYREPNLLRLAPVALFNTEAELDTVVTALRELLDTQSYRSVDTDGLVT
jgi:kynureninase